MKDPIKNYPFVNLTCRSITGHRWEESFDNLPMYTRPTGEICIGIDFVCERCTTAKTVFYDRSGSTARAVYVYPEAYRIGAVQRRDLRLEYLRRRDVVTRKQIRHRPSKDKEDSK